MVAPITLITAEELQSWRVGQKKNRIGFVPTMGALHEGHLSLIRRARQECEEVVVSIFVNPTQFGPKEDFDRYPRTFKADLDLIEKASVRAVFAPSVGAIYSPDFQTMISNPILGRQLCGSFRPGHFDGVLTVVFKLISMVKPNIVCFGKKDYQQWKLIQRMVEDFYLPVEIIGCDTLRDPDGLAMSSRNRFLSPEERLKATSLYRGMYLAKQAFEKGERDQKSLLKIVLEILAPTEMVIDYVEIRKRDHLQSYASGEKVDDRAVILGAVRVGQTRLIDNLEF